MAPDWKNVLMMIVGVLGILPIFYNIVAFVLYASQLVWTDWSWYLLIPSVLIYFALVWGIMLLLNNVHDTPSYKRLRWAFLLLAVLFTLFTLYIIFTIVIFIIYFGLYWAANGWHWLFVGIQMGNWISGFALLIVNCVFAGSMFAYWAKNTTVFRRAYIRMQMPP